MKQEPLSSTTRPPKPLKPTIIHQDDALVVVNKPAGIWPREGILDSAGVFDILAPDMDAADVPFTQVNPLEVDLSGAVVYATRPAIAEAITQQFVKREARMVFRAVVGGPLLTDSGAIAPGSTGSDAAPATTWRVLDAFVGFTLIACETSMLSEGQIRKDLQSAGMPLVVDDRHGGASHLMLSSFKAGYRKSRRRPEKPLIERPSAHLAQMMFRHPTDGREMAFDIEPPKDFRALLNQLDRYARVPK